MTFKNVMTFNCRKKAHVNTACMSFLSTAYFSRNKGVTGSVLRTYALHTYHTKPRAIYLLSARKYNAGQLARRKAPGAICKHAWAGRQAGLGLPWAALLLMYPGPVRAWHGLSGLGQSALAKAGRPMEGSQAGVGQPGRARSPRQVHAASQGSHPAMHKATPSRTTKGNRNVCVYLQLHYRSLKIRSCTTNCQLQP